MTESRNGARLVVESRQPGGVGGDVRRQNLQGNVTAEPSVPGAVDLPHPSGPERRDDVIRAKPSTGRERHGGTLTQDETARGRQPSGPGYPLIPHRLIAAGDFPARSAERLEVMHDGELPDLPAQPHALDGRRSEEHTSEL